MLLYVDAGIKGIFAREKVQGKLEIRTGAKLSFSKGC